MNKLWLFVAMVTLLAGVSGCDEGGSPVSGNGGGGTTGPKSDSVTVEPEKDNTIYSSSTLIAGSDTTSNALGEKLFVGKSGIMSGFMARRALVKFATGGIPAGAIVDSVKLQIYVDKERGGPIRVGVYRVTRDWGEGTSQAALEESIGDLPTVGDATWKHAQYDTLLSVLWSSPGGDFLPAARDTLSIDDDDKPYCWGSTDSLVADVQDWLDNPATNFGWILMGDETLEPRAKRFLSRHVANAAQRPKLTVWYTTP